MSFLYGFYCLYHETGDQACRVAGNTLELTPIDPIDALVPMTLSV